MNTTTEELAQITIKRYRDKDGNPACAADFSTGAVCRFYSTSRLGTKEHCMAANNEELFRRKNGVGCLQPCESCIVWAGTAK